MHPKKSASISNKKLVLFDCDGVLVDSESLSNRALIECLSELQIEMDVHVAMEKFRGRNLAVCFQEIEQSHNCTLPLSFESSFRDLRAKYFELHLRPIDGIATALENIPHAKCVASNGPLEMIKQSLSSTGLARFFGEAVYSAYQIHKWKPDPDLFLHACREMGALPADCAVVEDSEAGVRAALAAGMKVLAYRSDCSSHPQVTAFGDMAVLPRLIEAVV